MASPTIPNVQQAYNVGGTWLNTYLGNQYSQETVVFQNNSNTTLYTGDLVCSGNTAGTGSLAGDATALGVTVNGTASSWNVLGVVGGEAYNPGNTTANLQTGGALIPPQSSSWVYSTGTWTSGTPTITDATASTANIGKAVYGVGWPTTPGSQAIVISCTPGVSYGTNVAPNVTEGSAFLYYLGPAEGAVGPGWPGINSFGAGTPVPVVVYGWAYVNIGSATITWTAAAGGTPINQSAVARVGAQTAVALGTVGSYIAVPLESGTGVIGPDGVNHLIRAWVCRS